MLTSDATLWNSYVADSVHEGIPMIGESGLDIICESARNPSVCTKDYRYSLHRIMQKQSVRTYICLQEWIPLEQVRIEVHPVAPSDAAVNAHCVRNRSICHIDIRENHLLMSGIMDRFLRTDDLGYSKTEVDIPSVTVEHIMRS